MVCVCVQIYPTDVVTVVRYTSKHMQTEAVITDMQVLVCSTVWKRLHGGRIAVGHAHQQYLMIEAQILHVYTCQQTNLTFLLLFWQCLAQEQYEELCIILFICKPIQVLNLKPA